MLHDAVFSIKLQLFGFLKSEKNGAISNSWENKTGAKPTLLILNPVSTLHPVMLIVTMIYEKKSLFCKGVLLYLGACYQFLNYLILYEYSGYIRSWKT